ncbi:MAG: ammonium transporter [Rhodocyclaceae bacterium]|nr:ammonium transporter [Rhodocyclaceae bacterium]MBX3668760.1 ammonium transporter [Rhodocyclaceae bacterium]
MMPLRPRLFLHAGLFLACVPAHAAGAADSLKPGLDMVWLIAAGALVFFMQAGFALLESGMSRAKNAINVIMKNYCDMCFGALAFWALGYGLMFGSNPGGLFGTDHFLLSGLDNAEYGMVFFQMMFAATSATIVSGAIAERTRFSAYIAGSIVITALIYPIFGSWAWGALHGGTGWLKSLGFIDFAGSTVVHSVGGWCALAATIVIGPRLGRYAAAGTARPVLGHNLSFVALGAFVLWLGWFGFNGGSTAAADVKIGRIVLNTQLAGAAGAVGALVMLRLLRLPILMTATVNGSIAGLVAITAGCHVMEPPFAILTGCVGGMACVLAGLALDHWHIDDVVGAVPVHAVGGVWGTLAAGLFQSGALFDLQQLQVQLIGVAVAFAWSFTSAMLLYSVLKKFFGARVSTLDERRGLDFTEHYEVGYPEFQADAVNTGKAVS